MKKNALILTVLFSVLFLTACGEASVLERGKDGREHMGNGNRNWTGSGQRMGKPYENGSGSMMRGEGRRHRGGEQKDVAPSAE